MEWIYNNFYLAIIIFLVIEFSALILFGVLYFFFGSVFGIVCDLDNCTIGRNYKETLKDKD